MQVIRRGDRRPFYAPARYVVELRPEEIELASATAEVASTQRVLHGLGGGGMPFHQRHHPGGHAVQHRSHHGGNRGGRMGGRMPDSGGFCLPDSDVGGGGPHPLMLKMMPAHHSSSPHQLNSPQHPQIFSTFQTHGRGGAAGVLPLSSKRSSYSPKDYTTATASTGGGVSNSVEAP